jgi:hypothetical protein
MLMMTAPLTSAHSGFLRGVELLLVNAGRVVWGGAARNANMLNKKLPVGRKASSSLENMRSCRRRRYRRGHATLFTVRLPVRGSAARAVPR